MSNVNRRNGKWADSHPNGAEPNSYGTDRQGNCRPSADCDIETTGVGSCFDRATQYLDQEDEDGHRSHWHLCGFHAGIAKRRKATILDGDTFPDAPEA